MNQLNERLQMGEQDDYKPLLRVSDLSIQFDTSEESVYAVNGIDFTLDRGETLGIVGESGSGKSVMALSLLGLLEDTATITGSVQFDGESLLDKSDNVLRSLRGNRISMVFQDPGSALNPALSVGDQLSETIRTHQAPSGEGISRFERSVLGNLLRTKDAFTKYEQAWETTVELFERVGIPFPERRVLDYPHEFSGGMKQRALIAIAISCQPDLLICDEPTTALDVTIESQILNLIDEVQREFGTAVLFITHDMGVVRNVCDSVAVMYAGNIVEAAPTKKLFEAPKHPYTKALLQSIPRLDRAAELNPVEGSVPDLTDEPSGCPFAPRCGYENKACHVTFPPACSADPDDEPLSIRSCDTANGSNAVSSPLQSSDEDGDHRVHCVLYDDETALTTVRREEAEVQADDEELNR